MPRFRRSSPGPSSARDTRCGRLLGVGGMGVVYRVRDRDRDTDVALEVMLASLMASEKAVERFKHKA